MIRPFDASLWLRPGTPYDPELPLRPFAEEANRIQYMPWLRRRRWLPGLRPAPSGDLHR